MGICNANTSFSAQIVVHAGPRWSSLVRACLQCHITDLHNTPVGVVLLVLPFLCRFLF